MHGTIIDDISMYNRTHEMMSILTSRSNRDKDDVSSFGRRWDDRTYYSDALGGSFCGGNSYRAEAGTVGAKYDFGGIAQNDSKSVSFKPLCGLLSQGKYIPMMWGGLVFEFEIISDKTEAFADSVAGGNFTPDDTGSDWSMSDIRLTGDVVTLDSALMNSYSEHVLSGKSLNIQYGTYITMLQTIAGDSVSVNVSRAVSRLKTIFVTFDNTFSPTDAQKLTFPFHLVRKNWNSFYHPMGDQRVYDLRKN